MPIIDAGALEFVADLARPMVKQTLRAPGQAVQIPEQLSAKLNELLSNAMLDDVLALRERERTVPVENLRLTVR
ncbi:MAG: hypothetical protein LCH89_12475 [Proteobacteria bacterium]|nr:hypothetical protein [Pseudomonadota bacterium]